MSGGAALPFRSTGAGRLCQRAGLPPEHKETPGRLDRRRHRLRRACLPEWDQHDAVERIGRVEVLAAAPQRQACEGALRRVGLLHAQIACADRPDAVQPRHIERLPIRGSR